MAKFCHMSMLQGSSIVAKPPHPIAGVESEIRSPLIQKGEGEQWLGRWELFVPAVVSSWSTVGDRLL